MNGMSLQDSYQDSHRWLSVYDKTVSTNLLLDALTVSYYGFLSTEERKVNQSRLVEIYFRKEVTEKVRERIRVIHSVLLKKKHDKRWQGAEGANT